MKVNMIAGIREPDFRDPLMGLWIEPVSFPMIVTNYDAEELDDPEEITLSTKEELKEWAGRAFDEMGYEVFDMEISLNYEAPRCLHHNQTVLDLISSKKAEYQRAARSTEVDAVLAALDTLHVHASALVRQESPTTSS